MEKERHIAKPIPGFKWYYATNYGYIYSKKLGASVDSTPIKKKFYIGADGYCTVGLTPTGDSKQNRYKVHRMIASTWLKNPNNLPFVNHIDGNRANNKVSNLEYISPQGNVRHAYDNGLINTKKRPVCQLDKAGLLLAEFDSIRAASKATNVYNRTIQQVCCGKRRLAGDFLWVYKENYKPGVAVRQKGNRNKIVNQYTLDGKFIRSHNSITAAAKAMKCGQSSLGAACRGEQKTCMKYVWKFAPVIKKVAPKPDQGTEDWVILPDYPLYKISREGRIFSIRSQKYLACHKIRGRMVTDLSSKDKVLKKFYVHRLVAEAYIPNPNKGPVVNHLDGNPCNNKVENLEWATYSRNSQHAYDIGLNKKKTRVMQLTLDGKEIKEFDSIRAAARALGVTSGAIHAVLKGTSNQSRGYKFKRI